jgi:hypothetical protein
MGRLEWVRKYRSELQPQVPLDFKRHRYLEPIYDDQHPVIILQKAAQMGLSEWAVTDAIWSADQRGANIMSLYPTDKIASRFSVRRIGQAIEASEYIERLMGNTDQVGLKEVAGKYWYIVAGGVRPDGRAPNLKEAQIDSLIFDELDELDPRVPAIALRRTRHSELAWRRYLSTPTNVGYGIHAAIADTDQRRWHIKCSHCNDWQLLDPFVSLITEVDEDGRPTAWHKNRLGEPVVLCTKCGKELDRQDTGEWIPTYDDRDQHGYTLNGLLNSYITLEELVTAGQADSETDLKEWMNQDMGLPYTPRSSGFDSEMMDNCLSRYTMPNEGQQAVMGVDPGKVLHVIIRKSLWDEGLGLLRRRALFIGHVKTYSGLDELVKKYGVRMCVIDVGHDPTAVTDFAKRFPGRVRTARYPGGKGGAFEGTQVYKERPDDEFEYRVDRLKSLDRLKTYYRSRIIENPASIKTHPDFYPHFGSMVRVTERSAIGEMTAVWRDYGRPDHFVHTDNYCNLAQDMIDALGGGTEIGETEWAEERRGQRSSSWHHEG